MIIICRPFDGGEVSESVPDDSIEKSSCGHLSWGCTKGSIIPNKNSQSAFLLRRVQMLPLNYSDDNQIWWMLEQNSVVWTLDCVCCWFGAAGFTEHPHSWWKHLSFLWGGNGILECFKPGSAYCMEGEAEMEGGRCQQSSSATSVCAVGEMWVSFLTLRLHAEQFHRCLPASSCPVASLGFGAQEAVSKEPFCAQGMKEWREELWFSCSVWWSLLGPPDFMVIKVLMYATTKAIAAFNIGVLPSKDCVPGT